MTALLAAYPLWWALGVADLSVVFLAIPMILRMRSWHRRGDRAIRVPPAFGLWLLFLICVVFGAATLGLSAPDTVVSSMSNRVISFADRGLTYGGLTVILLYAGNLTEGELPRRRLAWLFGLVGIYATIGGLGGVIAPRFQFTSPLAYVLPRSVQANSLVQAALYPGFFPGHQPARGDRGTPEGAVRVHQHVGRVPDHPAALAAWWPGGPTAAGDSASWSRRAAVALIPLVYSLNRTVWVAIGLTAVYLAVRLAARGKLALLGLVCAGLPS